jgi:muramoyltetrapeptide carboxypeptidase
MPLLPGIVFPSSPPPTEPMAAGLRLLPEPRIFPTNPGPWPFLAGDDADRTESVCEALRDPEVGLLIAARGGHGALRLDRDRILATLRDHPKPLAGFSDVTALHLLWQAAGVLSVSGPNVTQLPELPADHLARFLSLVDTGELPALEVTLTPHQTAPEHDISGPLAGGNLTVLASAAGTPWSVPLAGRVVILEEVKEAPYRLDRLLWQVLAATDLSRAAALVFGEFTECPRFDLELLLATCRRFAPGVPLFSGFPAGHGARNLAFTCGTAARLHARSGRLVQPAVRLDARS